MSWPEEHSLKRFVTRVSKSTLLALFVVLGSRFVQAYRSNTWNGIGTALLMALILGLVFGALRYLGDRETAINEREPNVL
jgi:hypothetical protein